MPITYQTIGTGMTARRVPTISGPFGKEEIAAWYRFAVDYNQARTFEGRVRPYEHMCRQLFAKAGLPPWDQWVRIHADGKTWTDDIPAQVFHGPPEEGRRYVQSLRSVGEDINTGLNLASHLCRIDSEPYRIDSEIWFACEFFRNLDAVRKARACHDEETVLCRAEAIGGIIATASLKFRWEADTLLGQETRHKRKAATAASIQRRSADKQERAHVARRLALDAWNTDPTLRASLTQTADRITPELNRLTRGPDEKPIQPQTVRSYLKHPETWCTCEALQKNLCAPDE